jgi:predicted O-linked N-acetylglucosamine transferase (SPINDLY family)
MEGWQFILNAADYMAKVGSFDQMRATCQSIMNEEPKNLQAMLAVGSLLYSQGFLGQARQCFERALSLNPSDLQIGLHLANVLRDSGNHANALTLLEQLKSSLPNHPTIRHIHLTSLEYAPDVTDSARLASASEWGRWADARIGGPKARPVFRATQGQALRIGYLSADFCRHTVGLLVLPVIKSHNPDRVTVFAYSSGHIADAFTDEFKSVSHWRDVRNLTDQDLAQTIRNDQIDVLIDLSGHTAGSRLNALAWRPAPVQIAWLGYFATTGLDAIDAVLFDEWHVPPGSETLFHEPVVRLPMGRMCYQPLPDAPAVKPPPVLERQNITFGCFNNTAKLNDQVLDVWAHVLLAVPHSRLVLKWRTLNDPQFCAQLISAFAGRGIPPDRIELRRPSPHLEMLAEYADIDIALDPFPFTGGLTSCEALWMGVPVITWPQSRAVSRQTFAFLSAIGLTELAAKDAVDYVHIAQTLAGDRAKLTHLRNNLRRTLQASSLMDVACFTRQLEVILSDLYHSIKAQKDVKAMIPKTVLHVGPGHRQSGAKLPPGFQGSEWQEIRLDIDPGNEPDIVGSMLNMAAVATGSVDALYSAHNIEHVYAHEVPLVLAEFLRVLKPSGVAVITCPDLQTVCALVADNKLTDAAYNSSAGPITPLDILYGHSTALAAGYHFMAHKTGFTEKSLSQALQTAGFQSIASKRRLSGLDLWMLASKLPAAEAEMRTFASNVFPN